MSYLKNLDQSMKVNDAEYARIRAVDAFIQDLVKARKEQGLTQLEGRDGGRHPAIACVSY